MECFTLCSSCYRAGRAVTRGPDVKCTEEEKGFDTAAHCLLIYSPVPLRSRLRRPQPGGSRVPGSAAASPGNRGTEGSSGTGIGEGGEVRCRPGNLAAPPDPSRRRNSRDARKGGREGRMEGLPRAPPGR